ncbi:MAG: MFS transporter [Candidatus Micrarchaeota archaeon]
MVIQRAKRMLPSMVSRTFKSLKHRNYRLWFLGQTFSLFGTWMQITAQGFLVFELTHSPAYLGLIGFAAGIPVLLLTPYGGVVADRVSRRKILLATQASMMLLAFLLAALTFMNMAEPWHIALLAFLLGIANAFDAPARQAFVLDMVSREDLTNAISLNGTMINLALVVGPALAGITYAAFGPAWCFILNGISFISVIIALLMMKLPRSVRPENRSTALADLKEGFRYTRSHPTAVALLCVVGITSLFGMAFVTIIPAWAVTILKGDAQTNGFLQTARGAGALIVALWVASLGGVKSKRNLLFLGVFLTPLLLIAFAYVHSLELALFFILLSGGANILLLNMAFNLLQTSTTDKFRGRVMGINSLVFFGFQPIGSLWIGAFAEYFGEQSAVLVSALVFLLGAVILWKISPALRKLE